MKDRLMEYRPIFQQYNVQPFRVDDYGKVKKVYTNVGTFALKELKNKKQCQAVEQASFFYGQQTVPLCRTKHGALFAEEGGRYYYLMPWISPQTEERKRESTFSFFRDLALLHNKTIQDVNVSEEDVTKYYETRKKQWEKERSFLQSYAEQCEQEWYMSPFQLQFCTYFHEMMQAYWFAETQLEKWYEKMKETKKWRIAFVHGQAFSSHYVCSKTGHRCFLSWERAHWASPLADLLPSLYEYVRTLPPIDEEWLNGFFEYEQQLAIREEERDFFFSHAASPSHLYRFVSRYTMERKKEMDEYTAVSQLQREYWVMKHIEQIVTRLVQKEQALDPVKLESDGQQN